MAGSTGWRPTAPRGRARTTATRRFLVPCCEIPLERVTEGEAKAYRKFVEDYSSFWRGFFDPIAIRLQLAPEQYRVETVVLPLIDRSIYTGLRQVLGGTPEPLDARPLVPGTIASLVLRLNKEELLKHEDYRQAKESWSKETPEAIRAGPSTRRNSGSCSTVSTGFWNRASATSWAFTWPTSRHR